ncbi:TonB-dependent receptor [Parerythrobacter lacustris]|uniref:TonB-dependent receptor n=1 Tax=Parerythrobacter lacustris TaxID=2969984 RepID=A0ABT1XRW9_9SPHN|nr:TonB-dependent receptor [Parerythrobacter lacustris]MCR2833162.1 TonB-dependent receptor [Parerythrobacter lacustris]
MQTRFSSRAKSVLLLGAAAVFVPQSAFAQDDGAAEGAVASDEIVVSGFRESLDAAIAQKRNASSQIDVIVAEDIAKFPDTNLAESLQRIPGIALQKDAGEGRQIVVRGLGAQFTRVRVNGMEAIATSTDGASANRDRGFDFNVFASELFSSIVVHKTATASLDEGSLGAVVDLNTGNPLAYDPGLTFVGSAQARYNDLSDDVGPRLAGLLAWTNLDQTFGVSASLAYSKYDTFELGNNTVRWAQGAFRSVNGTACYTGSTYIPSATCNQVGLAFHPRIPRYGLVAHDRERLGATGSIQWAPSDRTKLSIDGLYSNFKETRDEFWGEILARSNERTIDLTNFTIDANNNIISGTLNNAYLRTERYSRESETEFWQISASLEQYITDTLGVTLRAGKSRSDADIPVESTIAFDDRINGYTFDYSDMSSPVLNFGPGGATTPAQFELAEFRDRPSFLTNKFETVGLDADWEFSDGLSLEGGLIYRRYDFDNEGFSRDSTFCAAFTCAPGQTGLPVTDAISEIFNLGDAGQPAGNSNSWLVPLLGPAAQAVGLYQRTANPVAGDNRSVVEKTKGGYLQLSADVDVGIRITGNVGLRYVDTEQTSTGIASGVEATVERSYDDWLPSGNINLFLTDDLVLRGAVAKVMTRPSLGNLTPGGTVDQFNFRITSGNPFLDPFRATAYDVALEYYFAPGALASVALFAKDIESFPLSSSFQGTFAQSGLPTSVLTAGTPLHTAIVGGGNPSVPIEFRTNINGPGANLKGVEFALQLPFDVFTEGFFGNFGLLANVTLVDSDVDYTLSTPATALNGSGNPVAGPATVFSRPLLNLAKSAANGTLYYEDDRFSARVSVAYRDSYLDSTSGNLNIFEGYSDTINVDASIRYKINDMIELSLEGTNLTDEYRERFVNDPSPRGYENNHFGRVFMAGVRVKI